MAFVGRGINTVRTVGNQTIAGEKSFIEKLEMLSNNGTITPDLLFHIPGVRYTRLVETSKGLEVKDGGSDTLDKLFAGSSDDVNAVVTTASKNKTTTGHFQLGNGLIANWGTMNAGDNQNITFSKAFSGTNYGLCLTYNVNASSGNYGFSAKIKSRSSTGFVGYGDAFSLWIAIGY